MGLLEERERSCPGDEVEAQLPRRKESTRIPSFYLRYWRQVTPKHTKWPWEQLAVSVAFWPLQVYPRECSNFPYETLRKTFIFFWDKGQMALNLRMIYYENKDQWASVCPRAVKARPALPAGSISPGAQP